MIIGDYPKSLHEALAVHVFLEWLGYSKEEEIFFTIWDDEIGVMLKADGNEAYLRIGPVELPPEEIKKKWLEFVAEWNTGGTMTREDKDNVYFSSTIFTQKVSTTFKLYSLGFKPRKNC